MVLYESPELKNVVNVKAWLLYCFCILFANWMVRNAEWKERVRETRGVGKDPFLPSLNENFGTIDISTGNSCLLFEWSLFFLCSLIIVRREGKVIRKVKRELYSTIYSRTSKRPPIQNNFQVSIFKNSKSKIRFVLTIMLISAIVLLNILAQRKLGRIEVNLALRRFERWGGSGIDSKAWHMQMQ